MTLRQLYNGMGISASDFAFVYSGGAENDSADASLGGLPSSFSIPGTIDNLFADVTKDEAAKGLVDFRCFYVFNDSADQALFASKVYIASQVPDGAFADVGFLLRDDVQAVTFHGPCAAGEATFTYDRFPFTVRFDQDRDRFANAFQDALNATRQVTAASAAGATDNGAVTVTVTFSGADGRKFHPKIQTSSNDIAGCTGITVSKLQDGSPVNAVAPAVPSRTSAPPGVGFSSPNAASPLAVGTVRPGDGFPVWVRRTTPRGSTGVRGDGFRFRLAGEPTPAAVVNPPPTFGFASGGLVGVGGDASFTLHGPGYHEAESEGGPGVGGEGSYTLLVVVDGRPRYTSSMTGGALAAGEPLVSYVKAAVYETAGGLGAAGHAAATTTGVDFVSTCQIWGCDAFPISWTLSIAAVPDSSFCGCPSVPGGAQLDFNKTFCSWRAPMGGSSILGQYYEITYDVVGQLWLLKTHSPYSQFTTADCVALEVHWTRQDFNCCGANGLANSSFARTSASCLLHNLTLSLTPVKYCTPKPCEYQCGKCCRELKCPASYVFTTHFQPGSDCDLSPLRGTFQLDRNPAVNPSATCGWAGSISPTASWVMQYDGAGNHWVITVHDDTFAYSQTWRAADRDFACCGTTAWQLDDSSCATGAAAATTSPLDASTCH